MDKAKVKATVRINGGNANLSDSTRLLKPRELYLHSDGYLYAGAVNSDENIPLGDIRIRAGRADSADIAKKITSSTDPRLFTLDAGSSSPARFAGMYVSSDIYYDTFYLNSPSDVTTIFKGIDIVDSALDNVSIDNSSRVSTNKIILLADDNGVGYNYGTVLPTDTAERTTGELFFLIKEG